MKNKMEENKNSIDMNYNLKNIMVLGLDTMTKISNLNILIIGCRGLGAETAKNLILTNVKSVTLYDPSIVSWQDLSSNFYLSESDVNQLSRAQSSFPKLRALNNVVKVNVIESLELKDFKGYDVVCFTEVLESINQVIEANEFCRNNGIGFILSLSYGVTGFSFVDFGDDFTTYDVDGEEP